MTELFNIFLYQPIASILVLLYGVLPGGFGVAIIVLTILVRLILYPLSAKGIESQKALTDIQPKVKEIQDKYKDDQEKQVQEVLNVYKEAKINPFSGFLPLLIQIPILIALYRVLRHVQDDNFSEALYSFVPFSGEINSMFLGIVDLGLDGLNQINGNWMAMVGAITIILGTGAAQFFQMRMATRRHETKKEKKKKQDPAMEMAEKMQKQMIYFFPVFTVVILLKLPLAVGLYWLTTAVFSIIQQHIVFKKYE